MTIAYKTGQVILTNGSAVVTGVGTAWQTSLIAGGIIFPEADGNPMPIDSVDGDLAITSATKWQGASGTYNYALVRDNAYLQQVSTNSNKLAELIAELAAGTIFKYDAAGTLAGRATYSDRPQGFAYLVSIGVAQPQLYVKASATSGDWSGPYSYGKGDMGPATSLNFGATVTEAPSTPASVVVSGSGPYNLTFHIPRGADGDMMPTGAWTSGNNYSSKQVVTDSGSAYVCKLNHTAAAASEPGIGASWATYWDLFVSKGAKGDQGNPGDMDHSVYDPQNKHADAFLRSNHSGDIPDTVLFADAAAPTKKARFELGGITAGQSRVITLPDHDLVLDPAWPLIRKVAGSGSLSQIILADLAAYKYVRVRGLITGTGSTSALQFRVSTTNGTSFDSGSSDYAVQVRTVTGNTQSATSSITQNALQMGPSTGIGSRGFMNFTIFNLNQPQYTQVEGSLGVVDAGGAIAKTDMWGYRQNAVAQNAIAFFVTAGSINSYDLLIEGVLG